MLAAALMMVLLACTAGAVVVASAVVARHRAQAAADLAALAAAGTLSGGRDAACARAEAIARRMGAEPAGCSVVSLDVVIAVQVPIPFSAWGFPPARATARAGPVEP